MSRAHRVGSRADRRAEARTARALAAMNANPLRRAVGAANDAAERADRWMRDKIAGRKPVKKTTKKPTKKRAKKPEKKPESFSKRILRGTRMWLLKRAAEAKKKAAYDAARRKKDMATKKRVAKKSATAAKKPGKRKLNAALSKKLKPSAALAAVIGAAPVGRGTATKKLWVYIRRHKLQVPTDMRSVKPDAKLAKVFGGPRAITMFMIAKKLSAHLS